MIVTVPEDHGATDVLAVEGNAIRLRPHDFPEDVYPAVWYYFCVTNDGREPATAEVTLEDLPVSAPELVPICYEPFWRNSLWSAGGRSWERVPDDCQTFGDDTLEIRRRLEPDESVWVAETFPFTYADYVEFIAKCRQAASSGVERSVIRLGESEEGRAIHAMRLARSAEASRHSILLVSGQHAVEESAKVFTHTVVEWLSRHGAGDAPAKAILDACDVYVVPLANPDGCVAGRMNTTAVGLNMLTEPTKEGQCVLDLIDEIKPRLLINAHGWGNLMGVAPHDGWYRWDDDDVLFQHMRRNVFGVASVEEGERGNPSKSLLQESFQLESYARDRYGTHVGILEINWNSYKPTADHPEVEPTYEQLQTRSIEYFVGAASMILDDPN